MNLKSFIIAHFHECDAQLPGNEANEVHSFSESHGGILLLATDDTEIWAYPHENDPDLLEQDWFSWTNDKDRAVHFEWIEDPKSWAENWSNSFPNRVETALKTFLTK